MRKIERENFKNPAKRLVSLQNQSCKKGLGSINPKSKNWTARDVIDLLALQRIAISQRERERVTD